MVGESITEDSWDLHHLSKHFNTTLFCEASFWFLKVWFLTSTVLFECVGVCVILGQNTCLTELLTSCRFSVWLKDAFRRIDLNPWCRWSDHPEQWDHPYFRMSEFRKARLIHKTRGQTRLHYKPRKESWRSRWFFDTWAQKGMIGMSVCVSQTWDPICVWRTDAIPTTALIKKKKKKGLTGSDQVFFFFIQ